MRPAHGPDAALIRLHALPRQPAGVTTTPSCQVQGLATGGKQGLVSRQYTRGLLAIGIQLSKSPVPFFSVFRWHGYPLLLVHLFQIVLQTQLIEMFHRPWLVSEKLEQLAGCCLQLTGGGHHVTSEQLEMVQSLREQRGEIVVLWTDGKLFSPKAFQPEWTWCLGNRDDSLLNGQVDAESGKCYLPVLLLAASFARRSLDAACAVRHHDCCLDLVAMLTSRSGPALSANIAQVK